MRVDRIIALGFALIAAAFLLRALGCFLASSFVYITVLFVMAIIVRLLRWRTSNRL